MTDYTVAPTEARIKDLIGQMTLEEKAELTVGRDFWTTRPIERLGIPSIWLSDGPTGVRKAPSSTYIGIGDSLPATCFPTESALAASWDTELLMEIGRALGEECQAQGVQVLLAPGVNLKRSPLGGRNFEYFSEDPVLAGELAAAFIEGVQEHGVGTSLKHFVANEQETGRMYADSVVDERTLRELYLRAFEIAVTKADPWTLMAAYNRLNGTYCTEHRRLLHDILKKEWGFNGIVMSDWWAVNDRAAGIAAGLHLQMPGGTTVESVVDAVKDGRLDPQRLDEVVGELLAFILKADAGRQTSATFDQDAHHDLARRAAGRCIVVLKNEGNLLPLNEEELTEIALIGVFAREPRYQGAGSSQVRPTSVENAHDELIAVLPDSVRVRYAAGYGLEGESDSDLLQEAQSIAGEAAVAVVFVGLPASAESEGLDRTTLDLPAAHNALVDAVVDVQPRTIVVLTNGSAVAMPWASRVPTIVESWLGGQGGGGAIVDVLLGRVNPSGKLPETFPARLEDTPASHDFPGEPASCIYGERLFEGYRWYDARDIAPLFPFGHGLSYTTYEYTDLKLSEEAIQDTETLTVSCAVRNIGERAGRETVQLYVHERAPRVRRPDNELRGFESVDLGPGEQREVHFHLARRDFAWYDVDSSSWATTSGVFEVRIGASSRDIRLSGSVTLDATRAAPVRLSRLSPLAVWLNHPVGRGLVQPALEAQRSAMEMGDAAEPSEMMEAMLAGMPISKLVLMGALDEQELATMIETANRP